MENLAKYIPLIALFLVVIGWFISNSQANARESRKELRDELALIQESLRSVLDSTSKTLIASTPDDKLLCYLKVSVGLQELDLLVEHFLDYQKFQNQKSEKSQLDIQKELFFDLISGDFVLQPNPTSQEKHNFLLQGHSHAALIINQLKVIFSNEFRKKEPDC